MGLLGPVSSHSYVRKMGLLRSAFSCFLVNKFVSHCQHCLLTSLVCMSSFGLWEGYWAWDIHVLQESFCGIGCLGSELGQVAGLRWGVGLLAFGWYLWDVFFMELFLTPYAWLTGHSCSSFFILYRSKNAGRETKSFLDDGKLQTCKSSIWGRLKWGIVFKDSIGYRYDLSFKEAWEGDNKNKGSDSTSPWVSYSCQSCSFTLSKFNLGTAAGSPLCLGSHYYSLECCSS